MNESLDVAVIGAGHNGLVAAAYLARAGLSVEVFERRDVVGGACVTEELWPGIRASPGAYSLSLLRRRIIDELDLTGHGLHVETHDPVAFAPFPDGRRLIEWSDPNRTHEQIDRDWSRADADAYLEWAHRWDELAGRAQPLMLENASRERWAEAVGEEILSGSMLDELGAIPSPEIRAALSISGLIGETVGPGDPGTAFIGFYHDLGEATETGGWGYPRGGMGAVTQALLVAATAAGARVHTGREAAGLLVEDDRAVGVVLAGGDEVRARAVVSNADPVRTATLAGVPGPEGWSQRSPVVKVMALLDRLPAFPAWTDGDPWTGTITAGSPSTISSRPLPMRGRAACPRRPSWRSPVSARPTTRWLPKEGTSRRCSASASRRTWTRVPRPTSSSRASPRSAPSSQTASPTCSRWARESSRTASG